MGQSVFRSGGQEGNYTPITLTKPGTYTVKWSYEHYTIPDQFSLRFEGKELLNTGFVGGAKSGQFKIKVPEGGGKFAAVTATNNPQTQWYFSLEFDAGPSKPVAVADKARVGKDDTVVGLVGIAKVIDLAANDTDADGDLDLSSIRITSQPRKGKVTPNADGTVIYQPSKNPGRDQFFYSIKDKEGNESEPVKVSILGDCPDPAPLTVNGTLQHLTEADVCVGQEYHLVGRQDGLEGLLRVDTNPTGAALRGQILVFADRVEIKNALVFPLMAFGAGPDPLFYGDMTLPAAAAGTGAAAGSIITSSALTVTSTAEEHRFHLAGLWFQPDKLQLKENELSVAGNFVLPEALGGANIELPILNGLVFKESGVSLGGGKIAFPAEYKFKLMGKIGVKATGASIEYQAVEDLLKITGKFDLTSSIMKPDFKATKYGEGMGISLDFLGTPLEPNFIQVKNGVADLRGSFKLTNLVAEGGWGISEASLFMETTNGQFTKLGIGGKIILPFSRAQNFNPQTQSVDDGAQVAVGGEIQVAFNPAVAGEWGVTKVTAFGENLDIVLPIGGGLIFLENISATIGGWATFDPLPISLGGSLLFTLGNTTSRINWELPKLFGTLEGTKLEGNILNLFVDGTVAVDKLTGALTVDAGGYISVINENILKLSGRVNGNFDTGGVKVSGALTGFAGIVNGTADGTFFFSERPGFVGNATVSLTIPKLKAFGSFGGQNLTNANATIQLLEDGYNGNDFIQAWGKVSALTYGGQKLFDMTAGIKMLFKNGLFAPPDVALILGAKDVLKVGSWDTYAGQSALVMSAAWENEINGHVPVQVHWRNLETGEERFFTEDEFDDNGIAVIDQLTGAFGKTVVVTDPVEGRWDLILPTEDEYYDFGEIEIEGFDPIPEPVLDFTGAGAGDREISIDFRADNLQEGARVAFYWDDNSEGFDGTLIAADIVITADTQTFTWETIGLVDREGDGFYSVYAMVTQPDGFPVLAYHWAEFAFPDAADLVVERDDFPEFVLQDGYFTYILTLRNDGQGYAKGAQLSELIDGAVIEDVFVFNGDATIHRSDIGGGFVVQANEGLHQGESISVFVSARADRYSYHGTLGQDPDGNDIYEVYGVSAEAYAHTGSLEEDRTNNRSYGLADFGAPPVVAGDGDLKVERRFTSDISGPIGSVAYDLVVTNQGPGTVTGAQLTETVGGGAIGNYFARPLNFFGTNVTYDGQSLRVAVPDLEAGQKFILPVTFTGIEAAELTLQAEVRHPGTDIDHHNDFAIDRLDATVLGETTGAVDIALRIGSVTEGANGLVLLRLDVVSEGRFINLASDMQVKIETGAGLSIVSTNAAPAAGQPIDINFSTFDPGSGVWALNQVIQGDGQTRSLNITLQKDAAGGGVFRAELIGLRETDEDSTPANGDPTEDDMVVTTIGAPNRAPVLASLIGDVTVFEGQPFSFQIPPTSFIDPDGDAVRYSVKGVGTGTPGFDRGFNNTYFYTPVPDWLDFDGATGTFTGIAASRQSDQAYTIEVLAYDNRGGITADRFRLAVNDVRTAPEPNKEYPEAVAFVGVPFRYDLLPNIPYDATRAYWLDGDLYRTIPNTYDYNHISYEFFGFDGAPSWLNVYGGTVIGTPDAPGTYELTVVGRNQYYDGEVLDGTQTIRLVVVPIEPPAAGTPIETQFATENVPFFLQVPAGAFTDPNGDALGYWWSGLPAWLTYDLETGALSGTPIQGNEGEFDAILHASDGKLGVAQQTVHFEIANINDRPQPIQDWYSLLPDTSLTANVALNDTDKDSDPLTFALAAGVQHGSLAFGADGSFTYTPEPGFAGADFFTYTASDGELTSIETRVDLFVQGPPVGTPDAYTARMNIRPDAWFGTWGNRILKVDADHGVLANDDLGPNAVWQQASVASGPAHGVLALALDGSFTYRPDNDFFGTDSFTYIPWDGLALGEAVPVTITVPFENRPAAGQFDNLNTFNTRASVANPLTFSVDDLLANDNPRDGDPLSAVLVRGPKHGTLVDHGDGSFTYTPDAGFRGTDSIVYNPYDPYGKGLYDVFANIYVTASDAFIDVRDDFYATPQNTTLTVNGPGVARNDADPDTSLLWAGDGNGVFYINELLVTGPQHGTLNYFSSNGAFSYTPNAGFTGTDAFTYRSAEYNRPAGDGELNPDRATVTITVGGTLSSAAPVAVADSYAAVEDIILKVDVANGVLANDISNSGNTLVAELVQQASLGRVFLSPYGNFRYEPLTDFNGGPGHRNGPDAFTYRVWDGAKASDPVAVVINVAPVSDLPRGGDFYQYASPAFTYYPGGNVASFVNYPDRDGQVTAVNGSADNVGQFVQGTYGRLFIGADGAVAWQPDLVSTEIRKLKAGELVEDLYTFTWTNPAGSVTNTFHGQIAGINDPARGVADRYGTTPNTPLNVYAFAGVLANDIDPDGAPDAATLISGPANGTLAFNASGAFVYRPNLGFVGTDTFSYRPNTAGFHDDATRVTIDVQPLVANTPPAASADSYAMSGAGPLVVNAAQGVLANDTDAQNDPFVALLVTGPQNGQLALNQDGSFTYRANAGFSGSDAFTYRASDGQATSADTQVVISVPVNQAPVAPDAQRSTAEDTTLAGTLASLASDPDADVLSFSVVVQAQHGLVRLNLDGNFTYTPDANFFGSDSFTYGVSDGRDSDIGVIAITVTPVNDRPVASPISYQMQEDGVLVVQPPGPLANATDADGDPLSFIAVTQPTQGTFASLPNGGFSYTPPPNFFGSLNFQYAASDGTLQSNSALVTISVLPENDPPATQEDAFTTSFNTPIAAAVLANDSDSEGDPLTAVIRTAPGRGTAVAQADGTILYTPNPGFRGTDFFEYSAFDGVTLSVITPVTITVEPPPNVAPVARADSAVTGEDTSVVIDVQANDIPGDDDALTVSIVASSPLGTAHVQSDGTILFVPSADAHGFSSFTYRLSDGQAFSDAEVTIAIAPSPDAPYAYPDFFGIAHETATIVDLLAFEGDPDGDPITVEIVSAPQHGTLELNGEGQYVYTPDAGFSGTDVALYRLADGTGLFSDVVRSQFQVTAAGNTPPRATDASYTTLEDTALVADLRSIASDLEGDPLTFSIIEGPASGSLTLDQATGEWSYQPAPDYFGPDQFEYGASDGDVLARAIVRITVTQDNDAPTAGPDFVETLRDQPVEVDVLANDVDPEGGALALLISMAPQGGNAVVTAGQKILFTPTPGFTGGTSLSYRVTDPEGASAETQLLITVVAPPNTPPVATDQTPAIAEDTRLAGNLAAFGTDPDGDTLTARITGTPEHGLLSFESDTGDFTYTPSADFNGTDSFAFALRDAQGAETTATVTITVTPVPDPPTARPDQVETPEETPTAGNVLANDIDPDGDALTAYLAPGTITGTVLGELSFAADGSWSFAPEPDANGTLVFTYFAFDGVLATPATLTVIVGAVNDAPVARPDDATTAEDVSVRGSVALNDTDIDLDALTFALAAGQDATTALGLLALAANGDWSFTPATDAYGTVQYAYVASDGALSSESRLTITVTPVNDAPVAGNDAAATPHATPVSITLSTLLANDVDTEGSPLSITAVGDAVGGTVAIAGSEIVFTPDAGFSGQARFSYTLSDGELTDQGDVAVTVGEPPPPPPTGATPGFRFGDGTAGTPLGSTAGPPLTPPATVSQHVEYTPHGDGGMDMLMKGAWNAIKWLDLAFTGGAASGTWVVQNMVALYADFTGGQGASARGIDFTGIGLKRGTVGFGDGDDTITWVAHSNGGEANGWSELSSIGTGGGDDLVNLSSVRSSGLDEAMLAGRANGSLWNRNYDGRFSRFEIDLGEGDDQLSMVAADRMRVDVKGGQGADTITTGAGNDRIDGGAGPDTVRGGLGNDVFVLRAGDVEGDRILDFQGAGAPGGDVLEFQGFGPGAVVASLGGGVHQVSGNGFSETFTLLNGNTAVTGLAAQDFLFV